MSNFVERKVSEFNVKIDRETCISTENCINAAPDLFELDNDRICAFKEKTEGISQDVIVEACSVCPVNALYVMDKEGTQLVP